MQRPVLGGRYELGAAIGSGGFGTVFRARDRRTGTDVAVKLVAHGLGSEPAAQRLRREGAIVRRVMSRHVARVYDTGEDEHGVWLVTELIEGGPLTVGTLGRALLPHEVLRAARSLLEGLSAVHAAGVVHGDVKPSNVLTLQGDDALERLKIVDFGLARVMRRSEVEASLGGAVTREGTVIGTARYMAPEVLGGIDPTPRSDLYSAGLLLFELLDDGPLFPVGDARAQLRARMTSEPYLEERVPEPLSDVFMKLLACDPAARYRDAGAAYDAVTDLDTAPRQAERSEETVHAPRVRVSVAPAPTQPPVSGPLRPSAAPRSVAGPARASIGPPRTSVSPRFEEETSTATIALPSARPPEPKAAETAPPIAPPPPPVVRRPLRLTSLPSDAVVALRETLRHLDLPMLDALARRERGNPIGRIARAVALALRLEIDAAALILEPLAMQSDVARAIGAAMLAPRARRVTRARVDSDREDKWVATIDAELAAMLVALAASLGGAEDALRDVDRCARALARLDAAAAGASPSFEATRATVRVAHAAARAHRGELDRRAALDLVASLASSDDRPEAPFHDIVRALAAGALASVSATGSGDEARIAAELERAERIAADTGTTLLDACSATALGTLRVSFSPRDERALLALERASTLLAHGDAPSLEHEAEHHRAVTLVATSRWDEAIVHFRAAREAAHAERSGDLELLSTALEVLAQLAKGDRGGAEETAATLTDAKLATPNVRAAGFGLGACALLALTSAHVGAADEALSRAEARIKGSERSAKDVVVLVAVLRSLSDAAKGGAAEPGILERLMREHGPSAFYWVDALAASVAGGRDPDAARRMAAALARPV